MKENDGAPREGGAVFTVQLRRYDADKVAQVVPEAFTGPDHTAVRVTRLKYSQKNMTNSMPVQRNA